MLSRKNIDAPLGRGDDFTPINMTSQEGVLPNFFRRTVGEAWGGGKMGKQSAVITDKADKQVRNLERTVQRVKDASKKQVKQSEQAIRQQTDEAIGANEAQFRQQALDASTPQRLPPEVRQEIAELPPQDAVDVLQTHWTKQGFSEAKAKTFTLDADDFEREMKNVLNDSPSLREAAPNFVRDLVGDFNKAFKRDPDIVTPGVGMPGVTSTVTKAAAKPAPTGVMQGDELMELRNKYARDANTTGDSLKRAAYQKIKTRIDNMITDQLDGEDLARYQDDMSRWESFSTLRNATGKAANRKGGDFTPDEWLSATKNYKLASGKGVLQDTAQQTQQQKNVLSKAVKGQIANNPAKAQLKKLEKTLAARKEAAKTTEKAVKDAAPAGKPSLFKKAVASTMLGLGNPLLGASIAKGAASDTGRRIAGGGTKPQQAMAEMLRKYGDKFDVMTAGTGAAAGQQYE
jgi:hypothetical protein